MTLKDELQKLSEAIRQYRDEIRVQLHLAKEDVKDEWDDLEVHWERFRQKLDDIVHDAEESSQEARANAREIGDELKQSYERLKKRLK
ncbi:hypothetical protein [Marinobacter caseinilyticus]|uniref:hypothetical protein n=1 Tax=Marinobacter caseinilyticus TaxID=2692195 RepID=UPI001407FD6E|nr:hypothetical protein [Marinobacter caseinilyticus]